MNPPAAPGEKKPRLRRGHWSLACLFVEEFFPLFLFLSDAVLVLPLA
jgi:hypothetical protein